MPLLHVLEIPQWSPSANLRINDCGPACVAMVLSYYGKLGTLTVNQLAMETGLRYSDSGLLPSQLATLAKKHGLTLVAKRNVSLDAIRAEIDAGRPVIALVAFRFLLGRLDQKDNKPGFDGHFIVVAGYDDSHFVCNDSDVWFPHVDRGTDMSIPVVELDKALLGNGYSSQCLFVESTSMSDLDLAIAHQQQALALMIKVRDTPPSTIPADPEPIPDGSILVTVKSGVNIRAAADPNSQALYGGFGTGENVVIKIEVVTGSAYQVGGVTHTDWYAITARKGKGGFVAGAYLNLPS